MPLQHVRRNNPATTSVAMITVSIASSSFFGTLIAERPSVLRKSTRVWSETPIGDARSPARASSCWPGWKCEGEQLEQVSKVSVGVVKKRHKR